MKNLFATILLLTILLSNYNALAQDSTTSKSPKKRNFQIFEKTTVADPSEDDYDVKYIKLDLNMNDRSTSISGNVITKASVTVPSLTVYTFELNPLLNIDSVLINGVSLTTIRFGALCTVTLSTPIPTGNIFTAQVFYNGTPKSGDYSGLLGINSIVAPYGSYRFYTTFTESEPYHAFEWWPCKQSLRDKIDSSEIWVTVPDTLQVGSNGLLQKVTRVNINHLRYEWKESYPIDYYLISAAICHYTDYSYYMHFTGSTDSMLVQNYVYSPSSVLAGCIHTIDSVGMIIDYFSQLYGRYPFWREKYGHSMAAMNGAMENQTMTTIGYFTNTVIAHELGHQWFGDNVTCATWADIFMNEGFASFTEDLYLDHFKGHSEMLSDFANKKNHVLSDSGGSIYVNDTTNENRIFDYRLSYLKGACVLNTLRFVINNDSLFFNIFKTYQQTIGGGTGTINDFKTTCKSLAGTIVNKMDLDTFFNQWIYLQGFPIYNVTWNQVGSDIYLKLDQTTSMPSSNPLFYTPLELQFHSTIGDTLIRIFNDQPSQLYHFTWSNTTSFIIFDPNSKVLAKVATHNDTLLTVSNEVQTTIHITPNPTNNYWIVNGIQENSSLTLTDMLGHIIWQDKVSSTSKQIPASALSTGMYILQVATNNSVTSLKLLKE